MSALTVQQKAVIFGANQGAEEGNDPEVCFETGRRKMRKAVLSVHTEAADLDRRISDAVQAARETYTEAASSEQSEAVEDGADNGVSAEA